MIKVIYYEMQKVILVFEDVGGGRREFYNRRNVWPVYQMGDR